MRVRCPKKKLAVEIILISIQLSIQRLQSFEKRRWSNHHERFPIRPRTDFEVRRHDGCSRLADFDARASPEPCLTQPSLSKCSARGSHPLLVGGAERAIAHRVVARHANLDAAARSSSRAGATSSCGTPHACAGASATPTWAPLCSQPHSVRLQDTDALVPYLWGIWASPGRREIDPHQP